MRQSIKKYIISFNPRQQEAGRWSVGSVRLWVFSLNITSPPMIPLSLKERGKWLYKRDVVPLDALLILFFWATPLLGIPESQREAEPLS
jgi:hypothetical protein